MHNSDDTPLSEFLMNQAFSRGSLDAGADSRLMRGRIATLLFLPALALVVMFAIWIQNWIVGVTGYVLLIAGLWLYSERADQVAALVRRHFPKRS
jgi:hypothetical protein